MGVSHSARDNLEGSHSFIHPVSDLPGQATGKPKGEDHCGFLWGVSHPSSLAGALGKGYQEEFLTPVAEDRGLVFS